MPSSFMSCRRAVLVSNVATNAAQLGRLIDSLRYQEAKLRSYEQKLLLALREATECRKGFQEELDASNKRVQELCQRESQLLHANAAGDQPLPAKELKELQELQQEKKVEEYGSKQTQFNARRFEQDQVFKKRSLLQVQVDLVRIRQQKHLLVAAAGRVGGGGSRFHCLHK